MRSSCAGRRIGPHRLLMEALATSGNHARALQVYRELPPAAPGAVGHRAGPRDPRDVSGDTVAGPSSREHPAAAALGASRGHPPRCSPHGTVAFLFTDIEGGTRLWEEQPGAMHVRGATVSRRCCAMQWEVAVARSTSRPGSSSGRSFARRRMLCPVGGSEPVRPRQYVCRSSATGADRPTSTPRLPSKFPPLNTAVGCPNNLPRSPDALLGRRGDRGSGSDFSQWPLSLSPGSGGMRPDARLPASGREIIAGGAGDCPCRRDLAGRAASLDDPGLVTQRVAGAIGVREESGKKTRHPHRDPDRLHL